MIQQMADLGRYTLGQSVPLALVARDPGGAPAPQATPPTATVYHGPTGAVAFAGPLLPLDRAGPGLVFGEALRVGAGTGLGKFFVVYRFRAGASPGLATASFTVVGGGDAGGGVISLYSLDRPEASYVLGQLAGGSLVQGQNPHF